MPCTSPLTWRMAGVGHRPAVLCRIRGMYGEGFLEEVCRSTGLRWGTGGGGRKEASHLVPGPLLPEIHLILQFQWGQAGGQLVRGIDVQDLLCPSDDQYGRGRLHWQKQNRTCQHPLGTTVSSSPCIWAGLLLTQLRELSRKGESGTSVCQTSTVHQELPSHFT